MTYVVVAGWVSGVVTLHNQLCQWRVELDLRSSSGSSRWLSLLEVLDLGDVGTQLIGLKVVAITAVFRTVSFAWHGTGSVAPKHRRRVEAPTCPAFLTVDQLSLFLT
jgi:hypothetical protein